MYFNIGCRETNKLKCLLEYLWEPEEEKVFLLYLKRFNDTESFTIQLLFLLQRGKYVKLNIIKTTYCLYMFYTSENILW